MKPLWILHPWKTLVYFKDYMGLILRAGTIWGIKSGDTDEWTRMVLDSPLKYELEALHKRRVELTGKGFWKDA